MADFEIRHAVHIIKNFWVILASVQGTESTYQVQLLASARIVALQARSCAVTMPIRLVVAPFFLSNSNLQDLGSIQGHALKNKTRKKKRDHTEHAI